MYSTSYKPAKLLFIIRPFLMMLFRSKLWRCSTNHP